MAEVAVREGMAFSSRANPIKYKVICVVYEVVSSSVGAYGL